MPAGSPSVKAKGCTVLLVQHDPGEGNSLARDRAGSCKTLLLVLDHRLAVQFCEVTLGLRTEFLRG